MPAKPLTKEQHEDAARLRGAFQSWQQNRKQQRLEYSQDWAADSLGMGQSALSQYLLGRIPLNRDALSKICKLIGVGPEWISPKLAGEAHAHLQAFVPSVREPGANYRVDDLLPLKPGEPEMLAAFRLLDESRQQEAFSLVLRLAYLSEQDREALRARAGLDRHTSA